MKHPQRILAFSLLELLIFAAMAVGVSVVLFRFLVANKDSYHVQETSFRTQERIRSVEHIIRQETSRVGLQGCLNLAHAAPVIRANDLPASFTELTASNAFEAFVYNSGLSDWEPSLPGWFTPSAKHGTDVWVVRGAASHPAHLAEAMQTPSTKLTIKPNFVPVSGRYYLISDCESADIFKATSVSGPLAPSGDYEITHTGAGNFNALLSKAYGTEAIVRPLEMGAFYIRSTGRTNATGASIDGLYRMDLYGNETEVAEGISDMRLTFAYDQDLNGSIDSFVHDASFLQSNNLWPRVLGLQIDLLFDSIDGVTHAPVPFFFHGAWSVPTDYLARKSTQLLVYFRNRLVTGEVI